MHSAETGGRFYHTETSSLKYKYKMKKYTNTQIHEVADAQCGDREKAALPHGDIFTQIQNTKNTTYKNTKCNIYIFQELSIK